MIIGGVWLGGWIEGKMQGKGKSKPSKELISGIKGVKECKKILINLYFV